MEYVRFNNINEVRLFMTNYIIINNLKYRLRNILPQYTVEQNIRHHVNHIAKECGFIIKKSETDNKYIIYKI